MFSHPIRQAVVSTLAGLALVGVASCSSGEQAAPPPAPGAPPAAAADAGDQQGAGAKETAGLDQAHQGALALVALGGLGQDQGAGEAVRNLGGELGTDGQAMAEQLRATAAAQGVTLADQPSAEQRSLLADLQARTGQPFDQAWLRAAMEAQQQARDAANAVLASPDASEEAKAAARATLARLDTLAENLQKATGPAGADTPGAVNAGSGGQAADDVAPAAIVLVWAGVALLGGAVWWRRRTA